MNEIFPMRYGMKGNLLEDYYKDVVLDEEGSFPRDLMPLPKMQAEIFSASGPAVLKKDQPAIGGTSTLTIRRRRLLTLPTT